MSLNDLQVPVSGNVIDTEQSPVCQLGLIGSGIGHSLSPALYKSEATAHQIQCTYTLFDLDEPETGDLSELLAQAERSLFSGLNITIPCKQSVIPLLDTLSLEAKAIGAVNTVCFQGHKRVGYNTDAEGFRESFLAQLQHVNLERVIQFGAGGVGAATAFSLLELGAQKLTIVDVIDDRAHQLVDRLKAYFPEREITMTHPSDAEIKATMGIVNATPIGSDKYSGSVVELNLLSSHMWVADVVYSPDETVLLKAARSLGCPTLDGLSMLIHQAVRAFELFTGQQADVTRMLKRFRQSQANHA
ncbi:shikimate dehydrogenase [Vibrio rhizosphaerae]|uniref:shikimate dehydrogenase n=1 Tax=Vibrio rhizosphaerae TaxID=398736 RepID=UPI000A073ECC|nr:shikimate dehydrogenase [Vibrio rhizosphaerae]